MTEKRKKSNASWHDPDDAPDLSSKEWQDKFANAPVVRRRGRPSGSNKVAISIRLDKDVAQSLRALGDGWQSRVNDFLKAAMQLR